MLSLPLTPDISARLLVRALGGPGSGNFGHEGSPGEVGGSSTEGVFGVPPASDDPAPGGKFYYHSTSVVNLSSIKEHGLRPKGGLGGPVSLSPHLTSVQQWSADILTDEQPVALLRISRNKMAKAEHEPDYDPMQDTAELHTFSKIPPTWLQVYRAGSWKYLVTQKFSGIKTLGGPGSGNFGHAGRPGEVGGSAPPLAVTPWMKEEEDAAQDMRNHLSGAISNRVASILAEEDPESAEVYDGYELNEFSRDDRGVIKEHLVANLAPALTSEESIKAGAQSVHDALVIAGTESSKLSMETLIREQAEEHVQSQLNDWALTSGDSSATAVAKQLSVAEEFSLYDAAMSHFPDSVLARARSLGSAKLDMVYSRAEYNATQKFLSEQGIDNVALYRGHQGDLPVGHYEVSMQPASSWTTSYNTAKEFAYASSNEIGAARILVAIVPRARILSTAVTGAGCLNEAEVRVLGGKIKAQIINPSRLGSR